MITNAASDDKSPSYGVNMTLSGMSMVRDIDVGAIGPRVYDSLVLQTPASNLDTAKNI